MIETAPDGGHVTRNSKAVAAAVAAGTGKFRLVELQKWLVP